MLAKSLQIISSNTNPSFKSSKLRTNEKVISEVNSNNLNRKLAKLLKSTIIWVRQEIIKGIVVKLLLNSKKLKNKVDSLEFTVGWETWELFTMTLTLQFQQPVNILTSSLLKVSKTVRLAWIISVNIWLVEHPSSAWIKFLKMSDNLECNLSKFHKTPSDSMIRLILSRRSLRMLFISASEIH